MRPELSSIQAGFEAVAVDRMPTTWSSVDASMGGGLPLAGLHEWFTEGASGAPLGVLVHLAWRRLGKELREGGPARGVFWIGRRVWPYPRSLVGALRGGLDARPSDSPADTTLLDASVFLDASSAAERLWCAEQCLRCRGAACVVMDGTGFDMAATRRLQLASSRLPGECGVLALSGRPWEERRLLSAATTRWVTRPRAVAGSAEPSWEVELLRWKGGAVHDAGVVEASAAWERSTG